jgi:hypothetical protein
LFWFFKRLNAASASFVHTLAYSALYCGWSKQTLF